MMFVAAGHLGNFASACVCVCVCVCVCLRCLRSAAAASAQEPKEAAEDDGDNEAFSLPPLITAVSDVDHAHVLQYSGVWKPHLTGLHANRALVRLNVSWGCTFGVGFFFFVWIAFGRMLESLVRLRRTHRMLV